MMKLLCYNGIIIECDWDHGLDYVEKYGILVDKWPQRRFLGVILPGLAIWEGFYDRDNRPQGEWRRLRFVEWSKIRRRQPVIEGLEKGRKLGIEELESKLLQNVRMNDGTIYTILEVTSEHIRFQAPGFRALLAKEDCDNIFEVNPEPTIVGRRKYAADNGYYEGEPCICVPECTVDCCGECGCRACITFDNLENK